MYAIRSYYELRKFQLTKTLLTSPRVLLMDNPFIGLDASARELLHDLLKRITCLSDLQIVLVLSMVDDVPDFITHVLPIFHGNVGEKQTRTDYLNGLSQHLSEDDCSEVQQAILDLPYQRTDYESAEVVKLNGVSIRYGDRTILKELDWVV